jgi:hypothetical protein
LSGEEFNRLRLDGGNKSTVNPRPDDGHVAIFAALSTCLPGAAIFLQRDVCGTVVPAGAEGIGEMRHVNSFLRSASSRIGRRVALIVAIAAASLPSAGA